MTVDDTQIDPSLDAGRGNGAGREGRIALPDRDQMSEEQRKVYDDVIKGPRGVMVGPLRAVIHSPELADRWQRLGEFVRYRTILPEDLKELAIIVSAKRWNSEVEWGVHARVAREGGLPEHVISALRDGTDLRLDESAAEIYAFTRELQTYGDVTDGTYCAVRKRWGDQGVVELTAIIGYYTMVAMMLNAHRVPLPEGLAPVFHPIGSGPHELTVLAPGNKLATE